MATEMDTFVLQYQVELKDAINRLEQLNQRVEVVNKGPGKARKEFSEFAREAGNEIGRLIPGMDKVGAATSAMTVGFTAASAAVAALGAGILSVIKLRDQFNQQRMVGMDVGMSGMRLEEIERKVARTSGGTITREQTRENVKGVSDLIKRAYTDPTRSGTENRFLRIMGMNPGALGGPMLGTKDALVQLAARFQKMGPERAQGVSEQAGISKDFALTMAKLGPEIGKVTEMTAQEIDVRKQAEADLARFNDEMAKFSDSVNQLQISLGSKLLPVLNKIIEKVKEISDIADQYLPDADEVASPGTPENKLIKNFWADGFPGIAMGKYAVDKSKQAYNWAFGKPEAGDGQRLAGLGQDAARKGLPLSGPDLLMPSRNGQESGQQGARILSAIEGQSRNVAEGRKTADELIDQADRNNQLGLQTASQMSLAVNMFNSAVATFSNAIDERQAWAAWAGMVGQASGLGSTTQGPQRTDPLPRKADGTPNWSAMSSNGNYDPISGTTPGGTPVLAKPSANPPVKTPYDDIFAKAAQKYNLNVNWLKAQTQVESKMDPMATSGAGAQGLMQLMPKTAKSLGVRNAYDPYENIMAGAKLMRENLDRTGSYEDALLMYHGGTNPANYGPLTRSYPDKVKRELEALERAQGIRSPLPADLPAALAGHNDWTSSPIPQPQRAPVEASKSNGQSSNLPASLNGQGDWAKSPNPNAPNTPVADARYFDTGRAGASGGENREKINKVTVQANIAQALGVPVTQLQHGAVNRDDVAWKVAQLEAGYQNHKTRIQTELSNQMLTDSARAELMEQYKIQETGLTALRAFGGDVIQDQRQGPREITVGERAIQINVNGVGSPQETAEAVRGRVQDGLSDIVNNASDGVKL
jgi:hypothetical protein